MKYFKRAELLAGCVQDWLDDRSGELRRAVEQTTADALFPEHDIRFALDHIRKSVTSDALKNWVSEAHTERKPVSPGDVLCLHAGNLPLVGFQDVVAVLLSGHHYHGKLSRKDPWLLDSILNHLRQSGHFERIHWSVDLDGLNSEKANAVLFSGSGKSVIPVLKELEKRDWLHQSTKKLIRTAHASAAWFDLSHNGLECLAEAVFRYEGKGCRSVAAVFTPGKPETLLNSLAEAAGKFLARNPAVPIKQPQLEYRHAYNSAIGKLSVRAGNILLETGNPDLKKDGVVTITQAGPEDVRKFAAQSGSVLQTVYTNEPGLIEFERLSYAQQPEISWKPDGIDPLKALIDV